MIISQRHITHYNCGHKFRRQIEKKVANSRAKMCFFWTEQSVTRKITQNDRQKKKEDHLVAVN